MSMSADPLASALARLESKWGSAAIRLGNGDRADAPGRAALPREMTSGTVHGALALAPSAVSDAALRHGVSAARDVVSTGFPEVDAVLGTGGLPRDASAMLRGDASSGKTTLALRCMAEAQARGAIVAYLDLPRAFDPLEAVTRGVDLRWLLVLRPVDPPEGFALAAALLAGRTIDLLVVDLPPEPPSRSEEQLRRLAGHARRVGASLVVLEPSTVRGSLHGTLAEATSVRLELAHRAWIRLGRDVVGQLTEVTVAKNRYGPPGRRAELEILYADDGDHARAVARFATAEDRGTDASFRAAHLLPLRPVMPAAAG